jgi:competence protein ComEC
MDEIKRKLTLIEAQLSGRGFLTRLMATAPLFFLAVGLMAGIVIQLLLSVRFDGTSSAAFLWPWSVLLGCCAVVVCVCFIWAHRKPQPGVLAGGALLCFVALGAMRLIVFQTPVADDIRNLVGDERTLATVKGRILTRPHRQRQDWCFAEFVFTDPPSAFYLRLQQIKTDHGWSDSDGIIRVQVNEPTPNLRLGDLIQIYCWLHRFEAPTNPGQFDLAGHLGRRNIYLGASVPSRAAITKFSETPPSTLDRLRNKLSEAASQALLGDRDTESPNHGLLEALLLGNRENIDRQTYEAFRKTGLLHLISLSGLHLGIFVGLLWWLCKTAGLLKPGRALVCIVATAIFLMVVPPRAPTVRAAVIVWAFCAAILLRRHTNPLNTLCLAAIILLLTRPTQLFEVGWQLSFSCVAGILALTEHVEGFIRDRTSRWFRQEKIPAKSFTRIIESIGAWIMRLFSMGVAAWIGGAGILLYHFYTITPLTSLWTVLVFPLVAFLLTVGVFRIVLFFLLPTLSHLLGHLANAGAGLLIWIVKILAIPNVNCILIGHVALWVIVLYYGLVLVARFGRTRHASLKRAMCVALSLTLIGYIGVLKWQRTHRDYLSMTCLDVGHGQAILLQLPGTKNVLFDAGSMYQNDIGSRIVLPFLDYMGLGHLHAIAISHNDIDHINGIPEIVDRRRVDHLYANPAFFAQIGTERTATLLADHLAKQGHAIEQVPRTLQTKNAIVSTLWPPDESLGQNNLSDNDRSLVSQIQYAGVSLLLCSDIEEFAQQQLMALDPNLTARIVVVPHHGSTATRNRDFLPSLQPEVLIVSCGRRRRNPRQPSTSLFHPKYFSTAENGAISICVQASGMVETATWILKPEGN